MEFTLYSSNINDAADQCGTSIFGGQGTMIGTLLGATSCAVRSPANRIRVVHQVPDPKILPACVFGDGRIPVKFQKTFGGR